MSNQIADAGDGVHNRIVILENLLKKVVDVHLSTESRVKRLDDKLGQMELIAASINGFVSRMDAISQARPSAEAGPANAEVKQELAEVRQELAHLKSMLVGLTEKVSEQPVACGETVSPLAGQLELLNKVPELFTKVESQQSTILQVLETRIDPRLMIYLKPLIEMLEEEGRQAERMKDSALQKLNDLLKGRRTGTDREISQMLANVSEEIQKCQASFERTQQALQIVVTPFQHVGRLFRDNLEIIVQAHDLMAQLHEDLPRFVEEMQAMIAEKNATGDQPLL
ncbi:MAG: hypothetical protein HQM04_13385 [Magnetococcales bacterium]|nr:hypothetical protein [Magnetococcales bacterium]MBF0116018.1 hypothetical protein [Magnetococcales bacterium]